MHQEALTSVNNPDELTVFVNSVKITFLHYPFPLLQDLASLDGMQTASIQEIAAMKAYTIGRRTSLKDYVDMYELLAFKYIDLPKVLELAREKYAADFNDRLFFRAISIA